MRLHLRRFGAGCVALALVLLQIPAPISAEELDTARESARAVAMLNTACGTQNATSTVAPAQVAQAAASPAPAASDTPQPDATPTPTPTESPLIGPPQAPLGPLIIVPRPAATSPGPTPPPLPTSSPSPAQSSTPAPVYITPATAPPSSTPKPLPSISAGPVGLPSPAPAATASISPSPAETLSPNDYAILGNVLTGKNVKGQPQDLDGNVNIIYADGVLVGDHAHYDGKRYIDITGNTYIKNASADTVFYADAVRFDTTSNDATLINGRGESTQGVEQGKLHFSARTMTAKRNGVTHGEHASLTTCENQRGGYHIESKTLDIYPGDKAVARSAVLFLGALAVFYLPIVVISLKQDEPGTRRNPGFIPVVGYSATEGFWVKARVGFAPSNYYYGYYRVEEYTRLGLGLGYVGTLKRPDGRRQTDVTFYRPPHGEQTQGNNLQVQDQELFNPRTRGQFGLNYTGNYGPLVNLPPQYDLSAAVNHADVKGDQQNYSFHRLSSGSNSQENDYGLTDHRSFSAKLQNDISVSMTSNHTSYASADSRTLHFQSQTSLQSNAFTYALNYDRYDATSPSYVQKEPELDIRPNGSLFPRLKSLPINADFHLGQYNDPTANLTTSRGEARFNIGPGLAHVLGSDFSGQLTLQQDAYGTGDLKAQIGQQASLTTPLFGHLLNTVNYTEQQVNGPLAEPFKALDVLGNGTKQATDVLRIFNGDVYSLSLTGTTYFNRQAQAIGYQLTSRPSRRSTLLVGGSFNPGPGHGFDRTNVQIATPFGYKSDLQFATFVDWKARGRLESKNIYYRHIVGDCYEVRLSYNQDLKQVNMTISLLAFPSRAANFGIGQSTSLGSIIPQSFSSSQFYGQ